MYVIPLHAQPESALPGLAHRTLAGQAQGLTSLSIWRQTLEPGGATPPHRHDCEEVVVVEHGSGRLLIGGEAHAFEAGCALVVPRNADHQIVNSGSEPLTLTAAFSMTPVAVHLPDGSELALPWES